MVAANGPVFSKIYEFKNFKLKHLIEPKITFQAAKKDPGPLEIAIDGFILFETILGCKLSPNATLLAILQNILNQTYRFSADDQGVDAPGRGIVLRASFSF